MPPNSQEDLIRRTGSLVAATLGSTASSVCAVVGQLAKDGGDKLGAAVQFSSAPTHFKAIAAGAVVWQVGRVCTSWAFQDQMDASAVMRDPARQRVGEESSSSHRVPAVSVSRPFAYAGVTPAPKFAATPGTTGSATQGQTSGYSRWELEAALQSSKM